MDIVTFNSRTAWGSSTRWLGCNEDGSIHIQFPYCVGKFNPGTWSDGIPAPHSIPVLRGEVQPGVFQKIIAVISHSIPVLRGEVQQGSLNSAILCI